MNRIAAHCTQITSRNNLSSSNVHWMLKIMNAVDEPLAQLLTCEASREGSPELIATASNQINIHTYIMYVYIWSHQRLLLHLTDNNHNYYYMSVCEFVYIYVCLSVCILCNCRLVVSSAALSTCCQAAITRILRMLHATLPQHSLSPPPARQRFVDYADEFLGRLQPWVAPPYQQPPIS